MIPPPPGLDPVTDFLGFRADFACISARDCDHLSTHSRTTGEAGSSVIGFQRERMVVVKKLIAIALLAACLIGAGVGCSGGTTTAPKANPTK